MGWKEAFTGFLVLLVINNVEMHSYHLGACPNIEPQPDLNLNRMLGVWYVIEKTNTVTSCIVYNITKTDEPGEYQVEEISQNFLLALTPVRHAHHYTGTLKVPDSAVPAKMTVKFPLSVRGTSSFTVFMTDYETYAGIFSCQKLALTHRQSATILSRTRSLDNIYLDKIRSRLASFQVNPFELSLISQKDCPKDGFSIDINKTLTAKAVGVISKAGEKLGDGVDYLAEKTKEVYHNVVDTTEDVADEVRAEVNRATDLEADWLP